MVGSKASICMLTLWGQDRCDCYKTDQKFWFTLTVTPKHCLVIWRYIYEQTSSWFLIPWHGRWVLMWKLKPYLPIAKHGDNLQTRGLNLGLLYFASPKWLSWEAALETTHPPVQSQVSQGRMLSTMGGPLNPEVTKNVQFLFSKSLSWRKNRRVLDKQYII